jgi:hypothetical protein
MTVDYSDATPSTCELMLPTGEASLPDISIKVHIHMRSAPLSKLEGAFAVERSADALYASHTL